MRNTLEYLPYMIAGLLAIGTLAAFCWHLCLVGIRTEHRKRELEHAERVKAIECGYPLSDVKAPNVAVSIGVGVPSSVFGIAFVASLLDHSAAPFVWPGATVVGLAAVICGTLLATRQPTMPGRYSPVGQAKLQEDPDAYDVAGRRG